MPSTHLDPPFSPTPALRAAAGCCLLAVLAVGFVRGQSAADRKAPPLGVSGMNPGPVRTSATESWGAFTFQVTNRTKQDRLARVLTFYEGQDHLQYGRDVWVPPRSRISSWMLVGPAPAGRSKGGREIKMLLSDRTEGPDRLILPETEEKERSRAVLYRAREATTVILIDDDPPEDHAPGKLPPQPEAWEHALALARTTRVLREMSPLVSVVLPGALTPVPEAFEGVDHVVVATAKLVHDPEGLRSLRQWIERGGAAWVMLDRAQPEVAASLLGDGMDFEVIDRVSLTTTRIAAEPVSQRLLEGPEMRHEQPVDLVRVVLPSDERPTHTVDGWPAWFTRPLGRGKVVFTTLGARGWYRLRSRTDPRSPFPEHPNLPMPTPPLQMVGTELIPFWREESFKPEVFRASLTAEIGYSIVSRRTVLLVFAAFFLAAGGAILALRQSRRPELIGYLFPLGAVVAAGVFLALGESSRRAVPPTVAVGQIVDPIVGTEEASIRGLLAVYRPSSGPVQIGATRGGLLELDQVGVDAQNRHFVHTDRDAWHWEKLSLPAGVRLGSFRSTLPTGEPITAVIRFGPAGIEGNLSAGPFGDVGDAVLPGWTSRHTALRLRRDGSFTATSEDVLPPGQLLAGTLLTDRQQRRQGLYREFLKRTVLTRPPERQLILAWADAIDAGFVVGAESREADRRVVGDALLVIPARLERPAPGSPVTLPGSLLTCQRIVGTGTMRMVTESQQGTDMHLRFRVPRELLPFQVDRARLVARIDAPSYRVTVFGRTDAGATNVDRATETKAAVEVRHLDVPLDPFQVDITEERFLQLDREGCLHVNVVLERSQKEEAARSKPVTDSDKWTIHYIELEVAGRTLPSP